MTRRWSLAVALLVLAQLWGGAAERGTELTLVEVVAESADTSQSVVITSTAPASYSTRRLDPLTVLVTLRHVTAGDVASRLTHVGGGPVDTVDVTDARDPDGTALAHVRIGLRQPTPYEIRARRQTIQVRFTGGSVGVAPASARPVSTVPAPATPAADVPQGGTRRATAILSAEAGLDPEAVSVTLHGNGVLAPGRVHNVPPGGATGLPRVVVEFPGLTAEAAPRTPIGVDPVTAVRVGAMGPDGTQVVLDLARAADYRLEPVAGNARAVRLVVARAAETAAARSAFSPRSVSARPAVVRPRPVAAAVPAPRDEMATARPAPPSVRVAAAPATPAVVASTTAAAPAPVERRPAVPAVEPADPRMMGPVSTLDNAAAYSATPLAQPAFSDLPPVIRAQFEVPLIGGPASLANMATLSRPSMNDLPLQLPTVQTLNLSAVAMAPRVSLATPSLDDLVPPERPFDLAAAASPESVAVATTVSAAGLAVPSLEDLPRIEQAFALDGLAALPSAGLPAGLTVPAAALAVPTAGDLPPWLEAVAVSTLPAPPALALSVAAVMPEHPLEVPALEAMTALLEVPAETVPEAEVVAESIAPEVPAEVPAEAVPEAEVVAESIVPEAPAEAPAEISASRATERIVPLGPRGTGAQAPRVAVQQAGGGQERIYEGEPISMDFQNTDLRAVLRVFADISGLNLVIDPSVQGEVNVDLTSVPWDQAFDIILRANGLDYELDGTVVRIASVQQLQQEAQDRALLAQREAEAGELVLFTRTLSYARAEDLVQLITSTTLSPRGQVFTDPRTNTLIIRDIEDRLGSLSDLLDTLDRAEPQVEIEARIVQAGVDSARALGVQWGVTGRASQELGNSLPFQFPNRGGITGRAGGPEGQGPSGLDPRALPEENAATAVNLGVGAATSALGLTMGTVNGGMNLDVVLSALESQGELSIISSPRVVTQNNVQAEIVQGDQIPYQTVANNTVTVQFKDASLILRVTPQITAAETVIMDVELDNDFADFGRALGDPPIPSIVTQRARTTIQVADGETTVIGGIYENTTSQRNNRTPMLHRIPLLGWLFRSTDTSESTDELLIFLTPHIVPE